MLKKIIVITLLIIFVFSSCDKNSDDDNTNSQISQNNTLSYDSQNNDSDGNNDNNSVSVVDEQKPNSIKEITRTDLIGIWEAKKLNEIHAFAGQRDFDLTLNFSESEIRVTKTNYHGMNTPVKSNTFEYIMSYTLNDSFQALTSDDEKVYGTYIDYTIELIYFTFLNDAIRLYFIGGLFGLTDWETSVPKEITGLYDSNTGEYFSSSGDIIYGLISIIDGKLYINDQSFKEATSNEDRPQKLLQYSLTKVE